MEVSQESAKLLNLLITERKARQEAEELARKTEAELKLLKQSLSQVENNTPHQNNTPLSEFQEEYPDPIFRIDFQGTLLYVNTVGQQLVGTLPKHRRAAFNRLLHQKANFA